MSYYVRMIKKERWIHASTSEDDISGEAVTIDWNCQKDEWSVFKCDSYAQKDDELNKIVLRMVGNNPKKTADGVDLLFLDDSFIENTGLKICPDEQSILHCLHCNLRYINFDKIKKAVSYTIKNLKNHIVSYSSRDIRDLFLEFVRTDPKYIEEYKNTYHSNLNRIRNAFLDDIPEGHFL